VSDALAIDRTFRGKMGWGIAPNLARASVAREKPPLAKPAAAVEVPPPTAPPIAKAPSPSRKSPTPALEPIFEFASYESMRAAFSAARVFRGLSNARLDALADLAEGHTDKILGPTGRQNFGPDSFDDLCYALCIKFIAVRDLAREPEMAPHWAEKQRQASHARVRPNRVSKIIMERAKPFVLREMVKAAGPVLETFGLRLLVIEDPVPAPADPNP
jgi:hypothetical protein